MAMQNETKNLISLAWPEGVAEPISSSNTTPRTFTPKTYVVGLSNANYYRRSYSSWVLNPSVSVQNGISFASGNASGYGIAFVIDDFESGRTYDVTFNGNAACVALFYGEEGAYLGNANANNRQFKAPDNAIVGVLCFYAGKSQTQYAVTDIIIIKVKEN